MITLEHIESKLNSISQTACAAKWKFSTIWLNIQQTASCFHCPPENFSVAQVKEQPLIFHNTPRKISDRLEMLNGQWPKACDYCMSIKKPAYPDRVAYSGRHDVDAFINSYDNVEAALPEILEVSFDSYCDFACVYCNKVFSSRWHADLNKFGQYELNSERETYRPEKNFPILAKPEIISLFNNYVNDLMHAGALKEIKITGGEPLINNYFWEFVEKLDASIKLTINTNLGNLNDDTFLKISRLVDKHSQVMIHTSGESVGQIAEFIRDGKKWDIWVNNINKIMSIPNLKFVCNVTFNALSAVDTKNFVDTILKLRHGAVTPLIMSFSSLVTPKFLSCDVLDPSIKHNVINDLTYILTSTHLMPNERNGIIRLIQLLKLDQTLDDVQDFKQFISQYVKRRNKKLDVYSNYPEFLNWINRL